MASKEGNPTGVDIPGLWDGAKVLHHSMVPHQAGSHGSHNHLARLPQALQLSHTVPQALQLLQMWLRQMHLSNGWCYVYCCSFL